MRDNSGMEDAYSLISNFGLSAERRLVNGSAGIDLSAHGTVSDERGVYII